jgi:hypothetical protein
VRLFAHRYFLQEELFYMTTENILELAGIPLLLFVILIYYGMRVWIMKDISAIRGKNKPPVKDEENYSRAAGQLLVFFAAASFVMVLLLFWNIYAAVVEIVVCTLILVVLWSRMNKKYGD